MKQRFKSESIRFFSFVGIATMLFVALVTRLFQLQVLEGKEYRIKSDSNRIRLIETAPPRGVMKDREGRLLLTNRASYTCYGVPAELCKDDLSIAMLGRALEIDRDYLRSQVLGPFRRTFTPMRLQRDVSFRQLSAFEELRDLIPGAFLEVEQKRYYAGGLAAHALGYVSEVSKDELERFQGVRIGDLVGKRGLERIYDPYLRGTPGSRFSIVNALGQEIAEAEQMERVEPIPGFELWLSLDIEIQTLAESLLVDKIGAIVAMDARTGGVIAMASSPSYNPEVFAGRLDSKNWNALLEDPHKPMLNRAVQTMYPPGSVIKMAMLIEALESKTISTSFTTHCPGYHTVGNRTFKCWNKKGHGTVNIFRAVEASCDVFFYKVGLMLGVDGVNRALTRFHFGTATGVDQTSEADGLVPSEAYYNKRYGKSGWTKGFIPSIAIGQGEVLVTPMQMCAYICALGNGEVWLTPYLAEGVYNPESRQFTRLPHPEPSPILASPEIIEIAREGARLVVWGDFGTARAQRNEQCRIAGKTGTAQNAHGDDHAWFVGYAPYDDPIVACCALVEFGEHGSSAAAPIARQIMQAFVAKQNRDRNGQQPVAAAVLAEEHR